MLRLRHLLHPIRSAETLYRRVDERLVRSMAEHAIANLRRSRQDVCWCGGSLRTFSLQPSYGICEQCDCYVNLRPPLPEELQRLYSFDFYWHTLQKYRGHAPIHERPAEDRTDGRVEYWMSVIDANQPPGKRVLEIGCAHALLLEDLSHRGFQCVGVEVDPKTADWAHSRTGIPILSGVFPGIELAQCDLFLAFDVFEHSLSPSAFLTEAYRLLSPGGVAVIQTPIDCRELCPPFGDMFGKVFDDTQHLFVFSQKGIRALTERVGFVFRSEYQWRPAHEIVVLQKPAN